MSILLKNILLDRDSATPNDIFISKFLSEGFIPQGDSKRLHNYLNECLDIGDEFLFKLANHDELHELLTEATAPAAPDTNAIVKQILSKYNRNKVKHLGSFTKAASSNPELKRKVDTINQNIQRTTPGVSANEPSKISNIVSGLVSNMGSSIEQKANVFGDTVKDPKKLQKVMSDAITKITPILKGEDGKLISDIQELVKKNPGYANVAVGILINVAKMASIGLAGASGGTSVAVGAVAGIVLRTAVGRMKGEDWGTAAKKAIKVVGISLLSGAALKGVIGMLHGTGFISGMKSYFGFGGAADAAHGAADIAGGGKASIDDISKLIQQHPGARALQQAIGQENFEKLALAAHPTLAKQSSQAAIRLFENELNGNPNSAIKALAYYTHNQGVQGMDLHAADQAADMAVKQGAKAVAPDSFQDF